MPTFDLKRLTQVKGKQKFYQLTVDDTPDFTGAKTEEERNERKTGVLDTFEAGLETKYESELKTIYAYMNMVADGEHVSGNKYHELEERPTSDAIKDYEFKSKHLRIYCFKLEGNKIVAYCSHKNKQTKQEIATFRAFKLRVVEQLSQKKSTT